MLWINLLNLKFVALRLPEIIGVLKKLGSPWIRPRSILFSQIFNGLFFGWTLWIYLPNLKFVALRVPEIIKVLKKFGPSLDTPTLLFPKFFTGLCSDGPCECIGQICSPYSFSRSWDNSDCSFGEGLRTPNLAEGEAVEGRGWYRSKERL